MAFAHAGRVRSTARVPATRGVHSWHGLRACRPARRAAFSMTVADGVSASLKRFSVAGVPSGPPFAEARAQVAAPCDRALGKLAPCPAAISRNHSRPQPVTHPRVSSCTSRRADYVAPKAEIWTSGTPAKGCDVLISSEVPELLMNAERVLVLRRGRISGELRGEAMSEAEILGRAMAS